MTRAPTLREQIGKVIIQAYGVGQEFTTQDIVELHGRRYKHGDSRAVSHLMRGMDNIERISRGLWRRVA